MSDKVSSSGGIGFCGLLTIVFITLKLTHFIDWSWWLVLLPFYGPAAIGLGIVMVMFVLFILIYEIR